MPTYDISGARVRRKNGYMPCVLSERFDSLPPEEQERLFKQAKWADNITNAEWLVVLQRDGATAPNKSKLKRKAAGWLMALGRIAVLHPDLFKAICEQARSMYAEQVEQKYPWNYIAPGLAGLDRPEGHTLTLLRCLPPDEDDEQEDD